MRILGLLAVSLSALFITTSAIAQSSGTGTIIGTIRPFPAKCKSPAATMYGTIAIPGTSYSAFFNKTGKFAIYNVKPGTYSLGIWSLNGNSFNFSGTALEGPNKSIKTGVKVEAGETTNLGDVVLAKNCCGNGSLDSGELCDTANERTVKKSCDDFGFSSGIVICSACKEYDTNQCSND